MLSVVANTVETRIEPEYGFDEFWLLYPRRVAKRDARIAWSRIPKTEWAQVLSALVEWRKVWARESIIYIPYPATWLHGERWEDELPEEKFTRPQAQALFAERAETERAEMPESVRAAIAKLRVKT